ncbi:hypothetical protein ACVWZK_006380 [Bradyrhizobium sp. GM0.4]
MTKPDRVIIAGDEYVRWDATVKTVMALQEKLYAADQILNAAAAGSSVQLAASDWCRGYRGVPNGHQS